MPKRVMVGKVVSDKRDKTVTVEVTTIVMHPKYKKYIKRRKKFHAHDEDNSCKVGDIVKIIESRPISKTKKWVVLEKLQEAYRPEVEVEGVEDVEEVLVTEKSKPSEGDGGSETEPEKQTLEAEEQ